jgi:hypothetical protein
LLDRLRIDSEMRPPRALPTAHFERNAITILLRDGAPTTFGSAWRIRRTTGFEPASTGVAGIEKVFTKETPNRLPL